MQACCTIVLHSGLASACHLRPQWGLKRVHANSTKLMGPTLGQKHPSLDVDLEILMHTAVQVSELPGHHATVC